MMPSFSKDAKLLLQSLLSSLLLLHGVANGVYRFEEKKVLHMHSYHWKHQNGIRTNCFSPRSRRKEGATILEMKHQDHCSKQITNLSKKLQECLISDEFRVKSMQYRFKNIIARKQEYVSETQIPLSSGIKLQTLNYVVTIELGGRKVTVIVDTGSDLTWVQCQPCESCYDQQDPLFNPSTSTSYKTIPCNSSACQLLQFAGNSRLCGRESSTCNYVVSYGDGSYTRGNLGREILALGPTAVDDFVFGCGRNNKGLFGGASGLMGLGRSEMSLVSQTSAIFAGVFSYCLPSTEGDNSGSLTLGDDSSTYRNSSPVSYTRMISNSRLSTFYFLNLTGIQISGTDLQAANLGKGGILIDSGTVITRLAPSIYRVLRDEFQKRFSGFPPAPGFSILDLCFNLSGYQEVNVPTIKMQFEGNAEINIDVNGILYFVKTDASQVCLAFASLAYEDEIGIIGNFQQKNLRVIYDTKESKLGFAAENCNFI